MVFVASKPPCREEEPVHLPVMSRFGAGDQTERHGHIIAGSVSTGESHARENG